jgi:hypothetical protein
MPARLQEIVPPKCKICGKTATVYLINPDGKFSGHYCKTDGKEMVRLYPEPTV